MGNSLNSKSEMCVYLSDSHSKIRLTVYCSYKGKGAHPIYTHANCSSCGQSHSCVRTSVIASLGSGGSGIALQPGSQACNFLLY